MAHDIPSRKLRAAFLSTLLALGSIGVALSTLMIPFLAIKITLLVVAALLLVATGVSIAGGLARPKLPGDR